MRFNSPELVQASLAGDLAEVKRLVESGADVNSQDRHGIGPLLCFTPGIMAYLLAQGADPNSQTNEGGAPVLSGVAYMGATECVRLLLEAGADPSTTREPTGESALHACLSKPANAPHEAVRYLLKYGADPNHRTIPGMKTAAFWRDVRTRGETPLHRAAAFASAEVVQWLLDAGADKTLRDANGDSPQSWASWHWREKSLIDLLDPGS